MTVPALPHHALRLSLVASCLAAGVAVPAAASPGTIYTCIDAKGRRLTSDRPIPECLAKEQQQLNRDGSLRAVVPPTLTAEERAQKEARDREAAEARAAQQELVRRDRNLLARFPNEAAHQRARESALDPVRLAIKATEIRLRELAQQRKPLLDEAEFFQGKPLPQRVRAGLDANDAAVEAQRAAGATQQAELARINSLYDQELERLRRLWAGAAPGSLGAMAAGSASTVAAPPVGNR